MQKSTVTDCSVFCVFLKFEVTIKLPVRENKEAVAAFHCRACFFTCKNITRLENFIFYCDQHFYFQKDTIRKYFMKNIATLMTLEKREDFPVAALFQTVSNSGSGHNISKMQL